MMSGNFYKEGFYLALDNAKGLSKVADKSAEENEFGIAFSLKILAAEETIKAISLIIIHFNKEAEITGLDKIFMDHKTKHEILSEIPIMIQALVEIINTEFGILDYVFETLEKFPEFPKEELGKLALTFSNLGWVRQVKNTDHRKEESKKWWSVANLEKNRGFYVDVVDGNWHSPHSFTKDKYLEAQNYTDSLIKDADKLIGIFQILAFKKTTIAKY